MGAASFCLPPINSRQSALIVLSGGSHVETFDVAKGDAIFMQTDHVEIHAGPIGMVALAAYTGGGPVQNLLQRLAQPNSMNAGRPQEVVPTSLTQAMAAPANGYLDTIK
jgi:hypothetical protein